ncbi:hypothetical protein [Taylorella equigenitalis]|uniref:hypothetical protein n=1 Tax=Taylorella equigenitalis TaxID=29575 RepID=UPI00237CC20D|nr:hypothetical protein [Taylorella equigenitalis]WDU54327.1 hypothetical protein KPZ19_04905 [Taylorella equigenitalis]
MKLWISEEAEHTIEDNHMSISRLIEKYVNEYLINHSLSEKYNDWKWAFIAIVEGPIMIGLGFDEVVKRSLKNKVLEFRLKLDYDVILNGNFSERLNHIIFTLNRCLEHPYMTNNWKIPRKDIDILKKSLVYAKDKIISTLV